MTTANSAQTFTEVLAANPAPSAAGAQTFTEVVAYNPGLQAWGAGVFMEVICGPAFRVLTWDGKRLDGTVVG